MIEKLENQSHWTVEHTRPANVDEGRQWAQNRHTEVVAADIHRAIEVFAETYPDSVIHVVRKTSRYQTILIDRPQSLGDPVPTGRKS